MEPSDQNSQPENGSGKGKSGVVSRRDFLKAVGVAAAGAVGASAASCEVVAPQVFEPETFTTDRVPIAFQYPAVPYTPAGPRPARLLQFFTPHEAQTVEAFTARLLPGSPDDPGAREAGVVYYIDGLLAQPDGFAESVYRQPPFAATYTGEEPPGNQASGQAGMVIWIEDEEIDRYGYQSILNPREVMRIGLAALDRISNEEFGEDFADLSEEQQDQIIEAMLEDEVEGFQPLTPKSFFHAMRRYTAEGMFSDPVYGGNHNMAGWRLIGFPGAQRAYTPAEIQIEGIGLRREPWSAEHLPAFNPGERLHPNTVNPVTGTDEHEHTLPNQRQLEPLPPFQQQLLQRQSPQLMPQQQPGQPVETQPPQ